MNPTLDDQFERQFFDYVVDFSVTGSSNQQLSLQILSDADFEWWWLGASRTSNLLKVLMKEQGTGRDFIGTTAQTVGAATFNGIYIDNWCGQAEAGAMFPLAVPYVMPATRTYLITLTDSSGNTNSGEIVFSGFKLWPTPQPAGTPQSGGGAAPGVSGLGWRR